MTVLDPRNLDVGDLLALIRDISDRLDGIDEHLDHITDDIEDAGGDIVAMRAILSHEPGHDRGVAAAVTAAIADMHDRHSLIPVDDGDDGYEDGCICCLLRKNGYPSLADVASSAGSHGEEA